MATTAPRILASEWEPLKATIANLYLVEKKTLAQLVHHMKAKHNFNAR
jgi:hypothetical protein